MRFKGTLTAITLGAGLLVWMMAPMASASTLPARAINPASTVTRAATPDIDYYFVCNLTGGGDVYGCAEAHGSLHAVTLEPTSGSLTLFGYDSSTYQIKEEGSNLCLEYNASSETYPVRMDTCTSGRASQEWFQGLTQYQLLNDYSLTCLEGSETIGFGNPLTMSPCTKEYAGQNWVFGAYVAGRRR